MTAGASATGVPGPADTADLFSATATLTGSDTASRIVMDASANFTIAGSLTAAALAQAGALVVSGVGQAAITGPAALAGVLAVTSGGVFRAASLTLSPGAAIGVDGASVAVVGSSVGAMGALTVDAGASIAGAGRVVATVVNQGSVLAQGGALELLGSVSGNGSLQVGAGATLQLDSVASQDIAFQSGSGTLVVAAPAVGVLTARGIICGFAQGDAISVVGAQPVTGTSAVAGAGGEESLTLFDGAAAIGTLHLVGEAVGSFQISGGSISLVATPDLDALEPQVAAGSVTSIPLSTTGVPTISAGYAQAVADADALRAIVTPYQLDLSLTPARYAGPTLQSLGLGGTALQSVRFSDGLLDFSTTGPAAQVYRLYGSAFGRVPDPAGAYYSAVALETGTSLVTLAQDFIGSAEFVARYGTNVSDTQYVALLYQNVLGRMPDTPGLNGWLAALAGGLSRAQVLVDFSESAEHVGDTAGAVRAGLFTPDVTAAQVARLYDTALGRLPDAAGLAGAVQAINTGALTLAGLAAAFVGGPEFLADYGALDNTGFVTRMYANALHRPPDPGGLSAYSAELNAGVSRGVVAAAFSESAEHQADDAADVLNPTQPGVATSGPVLASASVVGAQLDALEASVRSRAMTSVVLTNPGLAAVAVTLGQVTSDIDAIRFISGSFYLSAPGATLAQATPSLVADGLGTTSQAAYVQLADGRLVFSTADPAAQVYRLYDSAFGRTPDPGGQTAFTGGLESGLTLAAAAQTFIGSAEFTSRYGTNLSDTDYVTLLYQNVLHRMPDPPGLNAWLTALSGGESRAQVLVAFSESPEHVVDTAAAVHAGISVLHA